MIFKTTVFEMQHIAVQYYPRINVAVYFQTYYKTSIIVNHFAGSENNERKRYKWDIRHRNHLTWEKCNDNVVKCLLCDAFLKQNLK